MCNNLHDNDCIRPWGWSEHASTCRMSCGGLSSCSLTREALPRHQLCSFRLTGGGICTFRQLIDVVHWEQRIQTWQYISSLLSPRHMILISVYAACPRTMCFRWGTETLAPLEMCPPGMALVRLPHAQQAAGAATSTDAKHAQVSRESSSLRHLPADAT